MWLLPFYIPVAAYFYYKKVRRTMSAAIVSYLLNIKNSKAIKGIGIIRRLSHIVPRKSLLTIYKSFIRPHLDYYDVIYDQADNKSFCTKIERIQDNAAIAMA